MSVVREGELIQLRCIKSTIAHYVSTSGYYGYVPSCPMADYVPPCPMADYENVVDVHQQQLDCVKNEWDDQDVGIAPFGLLGWSFSTVMKQPYQQQHQDNQHNNQQELICFNDSAMETDDDDISRREFVRVSRCENNRCVIPEAAVLHLNDGGGGGGNNESVYRVTEHDENAADVTADRRRGNRKRNSTGDPAYIFAGHPANITKKSKQDGGNGNVCNGRRRTGKFGSPAMHYEPTSLKPIGDIEFCKLTGKLCHSTKITVESCLTAAGNYDSNGDSNLERSCIVPSNGHDIFGNSYLDYEILLMETHGCSAYHYHSNQHFDVGVLEAEF